jgi:hypothetical protein
MIALLASLFPFLLRVLGEGAVAKYLAFKKDQAASATELEKVRLEAQVRLAQHELARRDMQRQLQVADMKFRAFRLFKFGLIGVVACYWIGRIGARLVGLDDFAVYVKPLDSEEWQVSAMVLGYLFIDGAMQAWRRA